MNSLARSVLAATVVVSCVGAASAQDLYDTSVLRTLNFQFAESNWETLLRNNYAAQVNLIGTLTVDGVTYPNVGVRIRGNTSYTALPSGSQKFSLNVEMDAVDTEQTLLGYGSLNLNNGFHDPTFCREVLYNNYVAQFMPNMRANHVLVTINGANWGVYNNVQQFNKTMLSTFFADTSGLRIKCANNPNGPGLRYLGAAQSLYTSAYEIKDDGGLPSPWTQHIAACNAVTNGAIATWQNSIDTVVAVDPSIWSVVFENIFTDDDSYVNKGADFMTYRNPTDGRTFILQTDANETFTQTNWSPTLNWTSTTKPFLNHLVTAVSEVRQRFFAHYRTTMADLNWTYFEPLATALRNQIDAAVQADPKKLYTYANFTTNFTAAQTLSGSGPAGGTVPGLSQFLSQRTTYLNTLPEVVATGPIISNVTPSSEAPNPTDTVTISANVVSSGTGIARVDLWYRPTRTGIYQKVQMTAGTGGMYSVALPIVASPGQRVDYYVAATASNSYGSMSFMPAHTEWTPMTLTYSFAASGGMRISEFMYSGINGEFIEFTNVSNAPIDLTGWSFDDDHAISGALGLSSLGIVQPGEAVVITETDAETFRTAWNLSPQVKILGGVGTVGVGGNNLARNDQINLYNSTGTLVDRLSYGDQTYPGTIRTQNASGQTALANLGLNTISSWQKAVLNDVYGSWASTGADLGTPGSYRGCGICLSDYNCSGSVSTADIFDFLNAWFAGNPAADFNHTGGLTVQDVFDFLNAWFLGCP